MGQRWREWVAETPQPSTAFKSESLVGGEASDLEDEVLEGIVEMAREAAHRPLRLEALLWLRYAAGEGSQAQRESATSLLEELAADADEVLAGAARSSLENSIDRESFLGLFE